MPNRNYEKGRRFEYARIAFHKKHGAVFAQRFAGSHGRYDLAAIYRRTIYRHGIKVPMIYFDQCKDSKEKAGKGLKTGWYYVIFQDVRKERK